MFIRMRDRDEMKSGERLDVERLGRESLLGGAAELMVLVKPRFRKYCSIMQFNATRRRSRAMGDTSSVFKSLLEAMDGGDTQPQPTTHLTYANVGLAFSFILFDAILSFFFGLGVGTSLVTSAVRCVVQLAIVATLLQKVFETRNPWAVAAIARKLGSPTAYTLTESQNHRSVVELDGYFRNWCVVLLSHHAG